MESMRHLSKPHSNQTNAAALTVDKVSFISFDHPYCSIQAVAPRDQSAGRDQLEMEYFGRGLQGDLGQKIVSAARRAPEMVHRLRATTMLARERERES